MLLVLCVDLDDDLGRKTGIPTPVVGRNEIEHAAVSLAEADPEDSDVNVLFEGIHLHDRFAGEGETVEVAAGFVATGGVSTIAYAETELSRGQRSASEGS